MISLKKKSEEYFQSGLQFVEQKECDYLTDIPIPNCLKKHLASPSTILSEGNPANRVIGFRIEMKGRRVSRTMKTMLFSGKIARSCGSAYVDSAKSHFVTKRGVTGIKVWINYSK